MNTHARKIEFTAAATVEWAMTWDGAKRLGWTRQEFDSWPAAKQAGCRNAPRLMPHAADYKGGL